MEMMLELYSISVRNCWSLIRAASSATMRSVISRWSTIAPSLGGGHGHADHLQPTMPVEGFTTEFRGKSRALAGQDLADARGDRLGLFRLCGPSLDALAQVIPI